MQKRFKSSLAKKERIQRESANAKRDCQVFIDVGASTGVKCLRWARLYPRAVIYAFEPLPQYFAVLKKAAQQFPNLHVFNYAVGLKNVEMVNFYASNDKSCSSLHPFVTENIPRWKPPPGRSNFRTREVIKVPCIRLDKFLREHKVKVVDFIKIDAQGGDLNVAKSLGKAIDLVREIVLEVQVVDFELYKGAPDKDTVVSWMGSKGFKVYCTHEWSRGQEENIWFVNHKYARRKGNRFFHLGL